MRPPLPGLRLSRRNKIILGVVAGLILLLILASSLTGVYVNWLWFGDVGYRGVYSTVLWTRVVLFLVFGVCMAAIIGGNLVIAYLLRPPFRPMSNEQQNLERYRILIEPRKRLILISVSAIAMIAGGISAQGEWATWQLYLHGVSFGAKDPQFHRDISFFAWDYPTYRSLLAFGFTAVLFAIVLSAAVHYLSGAIRLQTPGPKITTPARRHLTLLVFVFMVLKAFAYWLDRYGLVFSHRSTFTGASYTDVHAALPAKTILFWIAVLIAAGLLATLWLRSTLLPVIAFVSMLVLSILISGIYPALLQQVSVKPNASSKEAPYISRNIQSTRDAYGIQTGTNVTYVTYDVASSPSTNAIVASNPTVSDIRLLDPNVVAPTFTQQQQIRNVYGFAPKLDVDRYLVKNPTTGQEQLSDYVVGVRELVAGNLSGDQTNWINEHTVYTHGYGFVAAAANVDVTNNKDLYTEANIPPNGPLQLTQPASYFGELLPDYSIVGAKGTPQEYNGSPTDKVTYAGNGGVSLSSPLTRLAFALKYKETNFLLNNAVSASGARIIYIRDPRERVQKVAPFLRIDSDPYPIVDTATGHIVWIVDGYTTINNFPYSARNSLSSLTADSLSRTGKTASQPNDSINYIRNSVKATVDAYTGQVTLYQWDKNDPVLNSWKHVFPNLISKNPMPASILEHIRYPEDLFEVQRSLLGTYHVDDPVTFYNVLDKWTVPVDPANPAANQPPYYVLASPATTVTATGEFQLTTPMIVNSKQNLAAFVTVDSDPGPNYGRFTVLKVPQGTVTNGPEQVANILSTNPTITKDLSLFNAAGGGTSVVHGNLLTLPVGSSFLYVEPLYVQATQNQGTFPILQRVLVVYGDKIGYAANLTDALQNLSVGPVGVSVAQGAGSTTTTTPSPSSSSSPTAPPSGSSSSTTPTNPTAAQLLVQVNQAFAALQAAYLTGDPAKVGTAEAALKLLVAQYVQLTGAQPSGTPTH